MNDIVTAEYPTTELAHMVIRRAIAVNSGIDWCLNSLPGGRKVSSDFWASAQEVSGRQDYDPFYRGEKYEPLLFSLAAHRPARLNKAAYIETVRNVRRQMDRVAGQDEKLWGFVTEHGTRPSEELSCRLGLGRVDRTWSLSRLPNLNSCPDLGSRSLPAVSARLFTT